MLNYTYRQCKVTATIAADYYRADISRYVIISAGLGLPDEITISENKTIEWVIEVMRNDEQVSNIFISPYFTSVSITTF